MTIARRDPNIVMRLSRLGSFHQSRLSFMRILLRKLVTQNWAFSRTVFEIDASGVGHAVYTARGPERSYSLIAFAHDLPDEKRSDRVIADAWDATFTLFDGVPDTKDIARLSQNVPYQEAGRVSDKELCLSRANRSVRLWSYVVDRLSQGLQPDPVKLAEVGYMMRTTAVYGSGKFGAADRDTYACRPEMQAPFQAEMLIVYLIRWFVRDLVEHMAAVQGGSSAVKLDEDLACQLGIGNSTGLGMAPFLINHPVLINNWIMAREEAIARVRSLKNVSENAVTQFVELLHRTVQSTAKWQTAHGFQLQKIDRLKTDLALVKNWLLQQLPPYADIWDSLFVWAEENLSEEGQECIASLILEPYPDLVDGLDICMADPHSSNFVLDGSMSVQKVIELLKFCFGWAEDIDWDATAANARAWYVSEEKLEPRLGERFEEPIADYEQPLQPARDAIMALDVLKTWSADTSIADFLLAYPQYRTVIKRAQLSSFAPYGEVRDNTISAEMMPIDLLRAKLSFFGAIHFDPRSDRWVRICMYSGAPYPDALKLDNADHWIYPSGAA